MCIAVHMASLMFNFAWPKGLGRAVTEVMFDLKPGRPQRRPGCAFISASRWPVDQLPPPGEAWSVVPDLAVEFVSPSNTAIELQRKIAEHFDAGVQIVCVVLPEAHLVQVHSSLDDIRVVRDAGVLRADPVIPGFELPLRELFVGMAPAFFDGQG